MNFQKDDFLKDLKNINSEKLITDNYLIKNTKKLDQSLLDTFRKYGLNKDFSLFAIGGYGREEIFPSSDVDISIIKNNKNPDYRSLEKFITELWDSGYKPGSSVRSLADVKNLCSKDAQEFTSYLTMRSIVSNKDIKRSLNTSLKNLWNKKKFFRAKDLELLNRLSKYNSTAFNLEPDLKESPGSMRDFQSALWILNYCFGFKSKKQIQKSTFFRDEFINANKSYDFIKSLRYATNLLTKKNRLIFDVQVELAKNIYPKTKNSKVAVEKMMQNYYQHANTLSNFNSIVHESFREKTFFSFKRTSGNFYFINNKIGIKKKDLKDNLSLIFDIFIETGKYKKYQSIDSSSWLLLKNSTYLIDKDFLKDKENAKKFIQILKSKYHLSTILKDMKNIGILQKYIPEFGEVFGQMQFDLFHVYTVDEHTLKVVRNMRQVAINDEDGFELEYELSKKLPKIELLYISGLFHDLGKGKGGNHSEIGAVQSYKFAKRLGLSNIDADLLSWLVLNHLTMSSVSQKKDIDDPRTISDFAKNIPSLLHLDYLYLLTINDVRATNPSVWNGWKHDLLKNLYLLTRSQMSKTEQVHSKETSLERKKKLLNLIQPEDKKFIQDFWSSFEDAYFNKFTSEKLLKHSEEIIRNKNKAFIINCEKKYGNFVEIFIKVDNADGLFLKLVKVISQSGLDVIDASIFTSIDNNLALNTFIAKYKSNDFEPNLADIKVLTQKLNNNFENYNPNKKTPLSKKPNKNFSVPVKISSTEDIDNKKNLITIETSDSPDLLVKIAEIFYKNGTSIYSARINTLGNKVEDTFEIEDMTLSTISAAKIKKITTAIEKII